MRKAFFVLVAVTVFVVTVNAGAFAATKNVAKKESNQSVEKHVVKHTFLVKQGMRGEDVKVVQTLLSELGYPVGVIDGVYGVKTRTAIEQFQMTNGLIPDGVVGEATLAYMQRMEPVVNRSMRAISMSASAYSAYDPGNTHYTARGSLLRKGLVAVDPKVIPLGTRLYIPGYGNAIADDIGGAIKGNRIDLAFDSHGEAIQFGRQNITVYIID